MIGKVQLYYYIKKKIPVIIIQKKYGRVMGVIEEIISVNDRKKLLIFDYEFIQKCVIGLDEIAMIYEAKKEGDDFMTKEEKLEKQINELKKIEDKELVLKGKKREIKTKIQEIEKEIEEDKLVKKMELTKELTKQIEETFGEVSPESIKMVGELLQAQPGKVNRNEEHSNSM
ncbi:hypothetical protein M2454_000784 [Aequitasia blattaphilus]|uniref:Uncharacterized protein n=1 Tax=Aequitasia blattaphilus TaxID=2949332 RepID=A0ABT1EAV2_9FIRM|nr:hypothetical protein [Aequitasia blattaphilus]MCP1101991.1 hypothetical protein [Aequitasia blattaphilus]MCR8614631.1 hypothetical protein [Aequitasia blattaphilus]